MGRARRNEHGRAAREWRRSDAHGPLLGAGRAAAPHQAHPLRNRNRPRTRTEFSGPRHAGCAARFPGNLRRGDPMIFSLDVRRANKGDCLIVHYGTKKDPGLILIDGGPAQVYKPYLKPRLDVIRTARKLAPTESLAVDLLMVSHIDDDHI